MSYYPEELLEEIRLHNDIVEVVSDYVKLEKKGKYYFGLCPFHNEKTPSFSVTPSLQIFNCFGCGKGGNVFHFIMNIENLDFQEAVKFLAEKANITLPEYDAGYDTERLRLKKEIIEINTEAARFFYRTLLSENGGAGRKYLKSRGLNADTIKRFGIGFSTGEYDSLKKYLNTKGYTDEKLVQSGLVIKSTNGAYDRFRNRIMFPIFDLRGNIIGFGGRVINDDKPKYMNSPETIVYNKRNSLYGLNFAKNANDKQVVIVEGYMDVISLHKYGIINSVASLGTALTESQGRLLKKYFEELIIAYDADTAGKDATMRGLDLLSDIGCNVKVLQIPDGKDPDEYIRTNGPEKFRLLMKKALSLVEYKISVYRKLFGDNTVDSKVKFLNAISQVLAKIESRIELEMYVKKLAGEYEISEESLYSEIAKYRKVKDTRMPRYYSANRQFKKSDELKTNPSYRDELMMIAVLVTDNSMYELVKNDIDANYFTNKELKAIAIELMGRLKEGKRVVAAEILNMFSEKTAGDFTRVLENECNFDENKKPLDIVEKLKKNRLEKRKREIFLMLKNRENLKEGDVERLTIELNTIVKEMKNI